MNTKKTITIIMAVSLILISYRSFAQTAEELLPKGIQLEEVKGELEKAIEVYQDIVAKFPENKPIAAKAQFHIGLCYEKLGLKQAQKAYQEVVNNYPDQQNEVTLARERLNKLIQISEVASKTPLVPKFTKIKIPTKLSWSVKLSPNGKELALVSDKKIWRMPLSGNLGPDLPGTPVQVNTNGIEVEWSGLDWSRDGKWIAFNDYPKHNEKGEYIENQSIFIVPYSGGKPKKLSENYRSARVVNYRISLSPDAEKIAFSSIEENKQHIFSTDIGTISPKQLTEMEAREPVFSPDGKYIAFVKDKNQGIGEGDLGLWVIEANGGKPYKLADAGKASSPIWSPDGKLIAFLDYSVGNQISIVPFSKIGNTIGKVIRINAPEGTEEVRLLAGWTPDNKIGALLVSKTEFGLYTLPAKGGQAAKILHDSYALQPRWSRNCEQIYYVATPEEGENRSYRRFLASVSASGGKGKPLQTNIDGNSVKQFSFQSGNRVSPDGKWIITSTWTPADTNTVKVHWPTSKIWKVSVDGDDAVQITNTPGNFADQSPCWSPDGKKVAFVRFQLEKGKNDIFGGTPKIYSISSKGGEPELLVSISGKYVNSVIWSPDGRTIAYLTKEINEPHTKNLNLIDIETKDSRTVGNIESANANSEIAWSPDSKKIAINDISDGEGQVIKIITLADESIEDISTGLVDGNIYHLDWSPDGERFVFGGFKGGEAEFWFLEDFLPLEKLAQNENTQVIQKLMTNKKIWEGSDIDDSGEISPDGKYLAYNDWDTGNLAVYEIASGKKRKLTNINPGQGSDYDQFAFSPRWSHDSRTIYYSVFVSSELSELRSIGLNDSKSQTISKIEGKEKWMEVYDLSNDEKIILTTLEINTEKTQIALVSVPDGKIRIIKEFPFAGFVENLKFTNDGDGIIYDYPPVLDSPNHDIYVLSLDGKIETPLIKHPANDFVLGLSPNGGELLFGSSRSGNLGFWSVGFENGKTQGVPTLIKTSEHPYVKGLGYTKNGAFVYCYFPSKTDVYETEINTENGEVIIPPREIVDIFLGANSSPDYSSDGKYMAFVSRRSPFNARQTFRPVGNILCVQSQKDGSIKEIRPEISNFGFPKWSPDNSSIAVVNWETDHKMGLYNVDIETGKVNCLYEGENQSFSSHEWSLDGKSVFMVCSDGSGNQKLVRHHIETGTETILTEGTWKEITNISRSADGKWIAFMGRDKNRSLKVIPSAGGEIREIHRWNQGDNRFIFHCWSADGKYIYLSKLREPKKDLIWDIWQIPVNGSEPKNLGLELTAIWQISTHPDGRHIAYSNQGSAYKMPEIWMMENFLPKEESENKQK